MAGLGRNKIFCEVRKFQPQRVVKFQSMFCKALRKIYQMRTLNFFNSTCHSFSVHWEFFFDKRATVAPSVSLHRFRFVIDTCVLHFSSTPCLKLDFSNSFEHMLLFQFRFLIFAKKGEKRKGKQEKRYVFHWTFFYCFALLS